MKQLVDLTYQNLVDLTDIATQGYITGGLALNVTEVNTDKNVYRKIEFDVESGIEEKPIYKRFFEISILNGKWYVYYGQYDDNGYKMLFIIYTMSEIINYFNSNDINYIPGD